MRIEVCLCATIAIATAGCGTTPSPPKTGTGSREAARKFYQAIVEREWPKAYDTLHVDSKKRMTIGQFALLASAYRLNLGFDPTDVRVTTCDEKGDSAIAHVALVGHFGERAKRFSDGVPLRKIGEDWFVVLPTSFGRKTK